MLKKNRKICLTLMTFNIDGYYMTMTMTMTMKCFY